ncbi:hypothetical protein ACOMHN_038151 [Nucella lapillus]
MENARQQSKKDEGESLDCGGGGRPCVHCLIGHSLSTCKHHCPGVMLTTWSRRLDLASSTGVTTKWTVRTQLSMTRRPDWPAEEAHREGKEKVPR